MNGWAVIIKAAVTPPLDSRQLEAVAHGTGGTVAYDSRSSVLQLRAEESGELPAEEAPGVTVHALRRELHRHAGAKAEIREARVLPWEEFEAETFRPSTPRGGLAGVAEAAEILEVSTARVHQLRKDHADFPRPVEELKAGPVWDRAEVEAWGRGWERKRTGRPRKSEA